MTLYLDGTRVELEESARDGYLELSLPPSMLPGSLRVRPVGTASVLRVELGQSPRDPHPSREAARLEARKGELEDRLKALAVREEVFSAAARSQSAKSAKKTKNNPDPVTALRQGTEFALTQLEGVYRARRKCEAELKGVAQDLARTRQEGRTVRVWLEGKKAAISYLTKVPGWTPSYSFRLDGAGHGELQLHARLPQPEKGVRYLVAPGALASAPTVQKAAGDFPVLSRFPLNLDKVTYAETPYPSLSFAFKGGASWLPAGAAAAYWKGAYLGDAHFAGGGEGELSFGR